MKYILENLLTSRIWTAALIGLVAIPCIVYSEFTFTFFMLVLYIISYFEWRNMALKNNAFASEEVTQDYQEKITNSKWIFYRRLFIAIVTPSFISLILARILFGYQYVLMYFVHIWLVDSFALIVGKMLKGPKLLPSISPNKTVSGFIFGVLIAATISIIVNSFLDILKYNNLFFYYCFIGILAQISDLLLSCFKRKFGIKDFIYKNSPILGSHGGILDRFDSIVLSAPIAVIIYIIC